ncbi:uncharacterized protein LOC111047708 [Nilaparvata lugens]|uniref:uncharacterized protein LOC111047708 n=1 Tax=Nilaparvata lugens TaxID=108931 RepID=UPI00193D1692|nr:uncharacterized protein LOC111047708 [Nilaparvata lugens]
MKFFLMAPRWSDELTIKFLGLYKQNTCLWDQFSPFYKIKTARDSALAEIVSSMNVEGFGVTEAKLKIKSLRSTYLGEVSKIEKSEKSAGSDVTNTYKPSRLIWMPLMKQIMEEGRQTKNLMVETPVKRKLSDMECNEEVASASEDNSISSICPEEPEVEVEIEVPKVRPAPKFSKRSSKEDTRPRSKLQIIANTVRQLAAVTSSLEQSENEHDIFGRHVAAQLRTLSPIQAVTAMSKINTILTDCRMVDLLPSCNSSMIENPHSSVPERHFEMVETESSVCKWK